jgi:hypothetical protein
MRICIIDPAHNIPGLTRLFPEASYYAHEPDRSFNYSWTCHMNNSEFEHLYKFRYRTDWNTITSENYDYVFIVFTLYDAYGKKPYQKDIAYWMIEKIYDIVRAQTFKHVIVFDTYDYPYDPNIFPNQPVDIFFKRNYSNKLTYKSNVYPFPLSMFVRPCVLWSMLDYVESYSEEHINKHMNAVYIGGHYKHENKDEGIIRDRTAIYEQIKPYCDTIQNMSYNDFKNTLKSYAICLDLIGVGDPNKRTFEIFASGSLWMSNIDGLNWGFTDGECFSDLCTFINGQDFLKKKTLLLENPDLYKTALEQQERLVRKYFNKDTLRKYIIQKIFN